MIIHNLSEADYRAMDGLSGTQAVTMLEAPAKLKAGRQATNEMNLGNLVHSFVLGTEWPWIQSPYDAFTTKEAKAWRDERESQGLTVFKAAEVERAREIANAVLEHEQAKHYFIGSGHSEVSLTWEQEGVACKGRIDRLIGPLDIDLKTARDASEGEFRKVAGRLGYFIQQGHYLNGLEANGVEPANPVYVVVETEEPYLVGIYQQSHDLTILGRDLAREAVKRYAQCLEFDTWPGLPNEIQTLDLPGWALRKWEALV